ncbi:InlB B-repeat-containing protein [Bombiscardovia coagulans]|uniref:Regulator of chromosome condensation (RCC1) repeat n=1 Tax=Bombiscardovia coagulans TaxID=686666 RepID=A0A261EUA5_9BIFI|nr:InlB B-repeat-containing protein [Bombiscardovia coagulans]OZG50417.1 Regulator of chromosome condensation (RCC1) repeat [Bombiscardovia coagulans]
MKMRKMRNIGIIVLALACTFIGGGLSALTHAAPESKINNMQTAGLTRAVDSADGFTLDPNAGPVGTSVKITPPGSSSSGGPTKKFSQISAFGEFALALSDDGTSIYAWGDNSNGELGIGSIGGTRNVPVRVLTPAGKVFTKISAGKNHSLALDSDGKIWSWGYNANKQLGIGDDTSSQPRPMQVKTPEGRKYKDISAGGFHSLAVDTDANAWGWGSNSDGQVGDNQRGVDQGYPDKIILRDVDGKDYKAKSVSAGGYHSVAVDVGDTIWTWGRNNEAQLGGGDNSRSAPAIIIRYNMPGLLGVSAGGYHTIIMTESYVIGCGDNHSGQVGNGTPRDQPIVYPISKGFDYGKLPFTTARAVDGNSFEFAPEPYGRARFIDAGWNHSLGIAQDGYDTNYYNWGWGAAEHYQIGSNNYSDYEKTRMATPARFGTVPGYDPPTNLKSLSAGLGFSVGLGNDGTVYTFGENAKGKLGDGSDPSVQRWQLKSINDKISTSDYRITGVVFGGTSVNPDSIGSSGEWTVRAPQHGPGTVDVVVSYTVNGVPSGRPATLHYTYSGSPEPRPDPKPEPSEVTVHFNLNGGSGNAPDQKFAGGQPAHWPDSNPKKDNNWFNGWFVEGGGEENGAWNFNDPVNKSMTLVARWEPYRITYNPKEGRTSGGEQVTVKRDPTDRTGLGYTDISAGDNYTLAVGADGYLYSWGNNATGQLGDGTTSNRTKPVRVHTPTNIRFTQVSAGGGHALALDTTGDVWGWGRNAHGQVGNQSTAQQNTPVRINRTVNPAVQGVKFTKVSAGGEHSTALDANGDIWSWGFDNYGQLGDQKPAGEQWHPVQINRTINPEVQGVKFTDVSAGGYHTVASDSTGEVWTWGSNESPTHPGTGGQLGIEEFPNHQEWHPVKIVRTINSDSSVGVKFTSVSASKDHTLALSDDGDVWAWGSNDNGKLGIGSNVEQWHPVKVIGGLKFRSISAGGTHSLAVTTDGSGYSWGADSEGQLGDDSVTQQWHPVKVRTPDLFRMVSAGGAHSVALRYIRDIHAWGSNTASQLGNGNSTSTRAPEGIARPFVGLKSVTFDKSDGSQPVWDASNKVWTLNTPAHPQGWVDVTFHWDSGNDDTFIRGYNYFDLFTVTFQVDNGGPNLPPQQVKSGEPVKWPDANPKWANHWFDGWFLDGTKAWDFNDPVTRDMVLKAHWESYQFEMNPHKGPVSGGTPVAITAPKPPQDLVFTQIDAGDAHTLAIGSDGFIYGWGWNGTKQIGDGTNINRSTPVRVKTPPGVRFLKVSAGYNHSLAIDTDGNLYGWGYNSNGQVGNGAAGLEPVGTPVRINTNIKFSNVSAGGWHSLAVSTDGEVYGWGLNTDGQVGNQSTAVQLTPTPIDRATNKEALTGVKFTSVSGGGWHSLALDTNGKVWAWGADKYNQLGDGSNISQWHPVRVKSDISFTKISAGQFHSIGLDTSGKAYAWGSNNYGQLGDGTNTPRTTPTPVKVDSGTRFKDISAGFNHSLATGLGGYRWSWGTNAQGQLGSGDTVNKTEPVQISTSPEMKTSTAGNGHSVSLDMDGKLQAWGRNDESQLGIGTSTPYATLPGDVSKQQVNLVDVTFDTNKTNPKPSMVGNDRTAWQVSSPAHPEGFVDVTVNWELGGYPQDDWIFQKAENNGFQYLPFFAGSHKVRFEINDPDAPGPHNIPPQDVADGQQVKWPAYKDKWRKHWFDGWFDKTTGKAWDFNDPVTKDMTLVAKWEPYKFDRRPDSGPTSGHKDFTVEAPDPPKDIVFLQVSGGFNHSVALGSDGRIYSWGRNLRGVLGDGRGNGNVNTVAGDSSVPVRVHTPEGLHFTQVDAGYVSTVALSENGQVYTWGRNDVGDLGNGHEDVEENNNRPASDPKIWRYETTPIKLNIDPSNPQLRIKSISSGDHHSLALAEDGSLYGWGYNGHSEIANLRIYGGGALQPIKIPNPNNIKFTSISAGTGFSLALDDSGNAYGWGENDFGQLGNGTNGGGGFEMEKVHTDESIYFKSISAGADGSMGLDDKGQVWTWGIALATGAQAPGNPVPSKRLKPGKIDSDPNVKFKEISAGSYHDIALDTQGRMWNWGENIYCQIAGNTDANINQTDGIGRCTPNQQLPRLIAMDPSIKISKIGGADHHSLAIDENGKMYSWGENVLGKLGDDKPVDVGQTAGKELKARFNPEPVKVKVVLYKVTFDPSDTNGQFKNLEAEGLAKVVNPPDPRNRNDWNMKTPPHPDGKVDVAVNWNLDDDYIFCDERNFNPPDKDFRYEYVDKRFKLPYAGALPLVRLSGLAMLLLSLFAGSAFVGKYALQGKAGRHNARKHS